MIRVLQFLFLRMWNKKSHLWMCLGLCAISIFFGTYLAKAKDTKIQIAVKDEEVLQEQILSSGLHVQWDASASMADLIMQKYDAIVTKEKAGYQIQSVQSTAFEAQLGSVLTTHSAFPVPETDKGNQILSFLVMFLMMQASVYMMLFGEDKEQQLLTRLHVSGLSQAAYLGAQFLFSYIMIYVPTLFCLLVLRLCGCTIGYSLAWYAWTLAVFTAVAVSFSLCVNAFVKREDDANLIGNAIIMLTSILSGAFVNITRSTGILSKLLPFLPQKAFLNMAAVSTIEEVWLPATYLCIFAFLLFMSGYWKMRKTSL